ISILETLSTLYPSSFQERLYHTVANPSGTHHLDRLTGVYNSFEKVQKGEKMNTELDTIWTQAMQRYLLY
ncbi:MAG TPA: hypothetical protein PKD85_20850, partial [Saprospiraceae bacterium]|nr:hypothetical protein [Saprospiraceae bacterium]